ncbi:MAG: DUF6880 family protein [Janthinobacterium lividum]
MASSKTLNAVNLQALGAARLATLLMEVSTGNAAAQRRLRLALAGSAGTTEVVRAVVKRLAAIGRAKTWLNWQKIKPFLADLEAQRRAILDVVAPSDPREAFELLWRLVGCADGVLARSDDSSGRLLAAFQAAARDLGPLAQRADPAPEDLAGRTVRAVATGNHGVWAELVPALSPQLGPAGLAMVKDGIRAWQAEAGAGRPDGRQHRASLVLQQIADASGDVDGFIEQFDARARKAPGVAASIARRLLEAGRPDEAWAALQGVEAGQRDRAPIEWDEAHVAVLQALGRADQAQTFRWTRFCSTLDPTHLRAYLKALPDFDDIEAEQRAIAHALAFPDIHKALEFLVAWPDLRAAGELVLQRARALNGDLYELLSSAAGALEPRHPLAATLLYRAIIGFTLSHTRSSRYKHAAQHLAACRVAAARVDHFGSLPDHTAYERALRATHARKAGFWQEVSKPG